jgi:hypothetical protein
MHHVPSGALNLLGFIFPSI